MVVGRYLKLKTKSNGTINTHIYNKGLTGFDYISIG